MDDQGRAVSGEAYGHPVDLRYPYGAASDGSRCNCGFTALDTGESKLYGIGMHIPQIRAGQLGHAVMVLECDQEIPASAIRWLTRLEGILKVVYLSASGEAQAL